MVSSSLAVRQFHAAVTSEAERLDAQIRLLLEDVSAETSAGAEAVKDRVDALYAEELEAVATAAPKRQWEYATGRWLARKLMSEQGLELGPIGRGPKREPVWPEQVVGSITHAQSLAVAAVARRRSLRAIGVDLELWERVEQKLFGKLFTVAEREWLADQAPETPGLLFSAKEAGYKATYPLAGEFIGFQDAEVDLDTAGSRFRFRYLGNHAPSAVMEEGFGRFLICGRYVLSLFIIP